MERIQQVFDNFKERLANPIFLSFIVSWVYWNWEIALSLIWNDSDHGYVELIEFVRLKIDRNTSLFFPLYSAIVYTLFLSPLLKLLLRLIQNLVFRVGEYLDIAVLKNGKVSLNKYLSLKEDYQNRSIVLEKLIENETEIAKNLENKEYELIQLKQDLNETKIKLTTREGLIQKINDVGIINGKWTKISRCPGEDEIRTEIEIMNNNVYIKDMLISEHKYSIRDFFYNDSNKSLSFTLFTLDTNTLYSIYQLNFLKRDMNGREYIGTKEYMVKFVRDDI
ncbi:MAG: hypothetical protein O9302_09300 [Cyclobacteriaceae bacterium]|jgi:hypothetical protein|nr:hypothetical protein [Cytophagales bacterium]MCZ8328240.1 hypothetical protein [Cyclobacteriaceae bacterium]